MNERDNRFPHGKLSQFDTLFGYTGRDIARMPAEEIQTLLNELHLYQMELIVQNEHLHHTQAEMTLALERFKLLYNEAPAGYLTLTTENRITEINKFAANLLGGSKQELIGKNFAYRIHPNDRESFDRCLNRLSASPTRMENCEIRLLPQHDNAATVALQAKFITSKTGISQVWIVLHDITARKHAEQIIFDLNQELNVKVHAQSEDIDQSKQELSKFEATLKSIFDTAYEGIITTDHKGYIISVNKAVTSLIGFNETELIGTDFNSLAQNTHAQEHNFSVIKSLYASKAKGAGKTREVALRCKNGALLPVELSVATFKIGAQRFFTGILRDARERKQKQQEEKQHLEELAFAARLSLMGEMAAGIAHEINQPLAAIAAYAQFLIRYIQQFPFDGIAKFIETLEKIDKQALHAGQKIHHLRDFVSRNRMQQSTININTVVEDAMEMSSAELRKFNIEHRCQLADNLPVISVNCVQIEQVLLNLIKNSIEALQHLPPEKRKNLFVQTYLNNGRVEIRVKDNGPGFNNADKEKIFQPFYTTKPSGTGMGLAISRSIIENHKGVLRCESQQNKGSTFYITLPTEIKL
ncbi:MAG: PAS domain-containing sensor histidine kinase [Gammaproteobacteria bacterium]